MAARLYPSRSGIAGMLEWRRSAKSAFAAAHCRCGGPAEDLRWQGGERLIRYIRRTVLLLRAFALQSSLFRAVLANFVCPFFDQPGNFAQLTCKGFCSGLVISDA